MTSRDTSERAHPLVAHRDAVAHGDGDELDGEPAGGAHAFLGPLGQPVERHVAGRDLVPGRRHADLGLVPVVVGHAPTPPPPPPPRFPPPPPPPPDAGTHLGGAFTLRVDSMIWIVAWVSGTRLSRSILSSVSMASNR